MKRGTRVGKPERGEQEPFSRQLAEARKENRRLEVDCQAQVEIVKRDAWIEIDVAQTERRDAIREQHDAAGRLIKYEVLHKDFARIAPVLRSRSFFRRLWWGLLFAAWGVFGYEVTE